MNITQSDRERFFDKVAVGAHDECWEWGASLHKDGYGRVGLGGDVLLAHRVSYAIEHEDPDGDLVLHTCDNPPCVNPAHLYLGDQSDNNRDAWDRGRRTMSDQTGSNNHATKLDEETVREIKSRYESEDISQAKIGEEYGVSQSTVSLIVLGETWGHV